MTKEQKQEIFQRLWKGSTEKKYDWSPIIIDKGFELSFPRSALRLVQVNDANAYPFYIIRIHNFEGEIVETIAEEDLHDFDQNCFDPDYTNFLETLFCRIENQVKHISETIDDLMKNL